MRLAAISAHIPQGRIDAEDIVRSAGGSLSEARVFKQLFGIEEVASSIADTSLSSKFEIILDKLAEEHVGPEPEAIIYVHGLPLQYQQGQSPVARLSAHPLLTRLRSRYEVDQYNCCGIFWALELANTLLHGRLAQAVLILAGDSHANLPLAERYVPGCTLMGEAYCGLIVDGELGGWRFQPIVLNIRPEFHHGRSGTTQQTSAFFEAHNMMVKSTLDEIGFDWSGSAPLLPHNVNKLVWRQFSREYMVDFGRLSLNLLPNIGHCYTTDPFLMLSDTINCGDPSPTSINLLSVGMGGFVAACEIRNTTTRSGAES
jgi:3-oxoacyl-[acyl-carrier-protein] synthase-3